MLPTLVYDPQTPAKLMPSTAIALSYTVLRVRQQMLENHKPKYVTPAKD